MRSTRPPTPESNGQVAVGVVSVLLMLGGAYLALTHDVALGAALLAIGAAITPSAAWWRPRQRDQETREP